MNIIIAGAGKVGFDLARTLCIGHNVIIIDKNRDALHRIQENLDILPMQGDVEDPATYQKVVDKRIDLFISVTNIDNVNLISTLIADSVLKIDRRFIRLKNDFFVDSLIKEKLNIDKMIFPIKLASQSIASLLQYPEVNNIKFFKYTSSKLISVIISADIEPYCINSEAFVIVGIERNKKFFIPNKDDKIMTHDLVYFFGKDEEICQVCKQLESKVYKEIKRCVVFGSGELGISIAKSLLDSGKEVKLVEKNLKLCEIANEKLEGRAATINCKYGTTALFEEEGLSEADIMIAATDNDEYNIIKCLEAKDRGINKVVAINNELEYYNLMHSLGIIVVRGPKMSAYNTIMEHISSTGVVIEKSFCGANAVVLMRQIFPTSKLINKVTKPIRLNDCTIFYIRDNILLPFIEKIILKESDLIIAFCVKKSSTKVKQWIYEL